MVESSRHQIRDSILALERRPASPSLMHTGEGPLNHAGKEHRVFGLKGSRYQNYTMLYLVHIEADFFGIEGGRVVVANKNCMTPSYPAPLAGWALTNTTRHPSLSVCSAAACLSSIGQLQSVIFPCSKGSLLAGRLFISPKLPSGLTLLLKATSPKPHSILPF